jgi:hypothetical protein
MQKHAKTRKANSPLFLNLKSRHIFGFSGLTKTLAPLGFQTDALNSDNPQAASVNFVS